MEAQHVGNSSPDSKDELLALLEELDALAPVREQAPGARVVYRTVAADEVIDDSTPVNDIEAGLTDDVREIPPTIDYAASEPETDVIRAVELTRSSVTGPIVAVDCGIARLGETENGLIIALRATIVTVNNGHSEIDLFRTGPIYLHNEHKLEVLHRMGEHLGKQDQFVEVDDSDPECPRPVRVKAGMAHDAHKYGDRFRNWFERLVQKKAVSRIQNGIVLLDGALTLRTLDTPDLFLERLANSAAINGNALVAISKQSMLQVQGKTIRFWLDDVPNRPCYRCLTPLMRREENERVLGNVYAARFSAIGPTFRMDVNAVEGQSDDEAISQFWSSTLMRGGYPDILVRAHTHSYFTSPDVIELQAQAGAKYRLVPRSDVDLSGIFGPFGGKFK